MQNSGIKARSPYNEINVKEIYNQKNNPLSGVISSKPFDITPERV